MNSRDSRLSSGPDNPDSSKKSPAGADRVDAASKSTAADIDAKTLMGIAAEADDRGKQVSVGENVGKYKIRSQLGTGGIGWAIENVAGW